MADRNPNPYTSAMYRAEYPGVADGSICPACKEDDSVDSTRDGVCWYCVCGCNYCEPEED